MNDIICLSPKEENRNSHKRPLIIHFFLHIPLEHLIKWGKNIHLTAINIDSTNKNRTATDNWCKNNPIDTNKYRGIVLVEPLVSRNYKLATGTISIDKIVYTKDNDRIKLPRYALKFDLVRTTYTSPITEKKVLSSVHRYIHVRNMYM